MTSLSSVKIVFEGNIWRFRPSCDLKSWDKFLDEVQQRCGDFQFEIKDSEFGIINSQETFDEFLKFIDSNKKKRIKLFVTKNFIKDKAKTDLVELKSNEKPKLLRSVTLPPQSQFEQSKSERESKSDKSNEILQSLGSCGSCFKSFRELGLPLYKCLICDGNRWLICNKCESNGQFNQSHDESHPFIKFTTLKQLNLYVVDKNNKIPKIKSQSHQSNSFYHPRPKLTLSNINMNQGKVSDYKGIHKTKLSRAKSLDIKSSSAASKLQCQFVKFCSDAKCLKAKEMCKPGAIVNCGSTINFGWIIRNNGKQAFPEGCMLKLVAGSDELKNTLAIPALNVDEEVPVVGTWTAPIKPGIYTAFFRCLTPSNEWFGQRLKCEIDVVKKDMCIFERQCRKIEKMGFKDKHCIRDCVKKCQGDLHKAVLSLVKQGEHFKINKYNHTFCNRSKESQN